MVFVQRKKMKDLLLCACVVVRNLKLKIWGLHLVDYVKNVHQKACRTCSAIILPHLTNQIIDLWRCRCIVISLTSYYWIIPPVSWNFLDWNKTNTEDSAATCSITSCIIIIIIIIISIVHFTIVLKDFLKFPSFLPTLGGPMSKWGFTEYLGTNTSCPL